MTDTTSLSTAAPAEAAEAPPRPPPTFDVLPLSPELRETLVEMGYVHPTPVQIAVWEPATRGKDAVVQARTGTGKTAAFGLPIVDHIVKRSAAHVQVLALCPTRELALQVGAEIERLGKRKNVQVIAVYGGAPMPRQIEAIASGAQVVVGTPGRVLDHLRRGTLDPKGVRLLVLDESDEMLSMGFERELTAILDHLPKERQTLLFSATVPPDIERMAKKLRSPEYITLSGDHIGALEIDHFVYMVAADKLSSLVRVIEVENPESAIVFCNTKDETERVAQALSRQGYDADWLNGDLPQNDREKVMTATREGRLRFLVATDVAARGIDISHLTHVINHDFPQDAEGYVHRTGRTGRAGRTGTAISLITPRDIGGLYLLRLTYKIRPIEKQIPTPGDLKTRAEADLVAMLAEAFAPKGTHPDDLALARRLLSHDQFEAIVAGLLRDHLGARPTSQDEASAARRAQRPRRVEPRFPRAPDTRNRPGAEPRPPASGSATPARETTIRAADADKSAGTAPVAAGIPSAAQDVRPAPDARPAPGTAVGATMPAARPEAREASPGAIGRADARGPDTARAMREPRAAAEDTRGGETRGGETRGSEMRSRTREGRAEPREGRAEPRVDLRGEIRSGEIRSGEAPGEGPRARADSRDLGPRRRPADRRDERGEGRREPRPAGDRPNDRASEPRTPLSGRGSERGPSEGAARRPEARVSGAPTATMPSRGGRHSDFVTWQPPEEEGDDQPILSAPAAGRAADSPQGSARRTAEPEPVTSNDADFVEIFVNIGRRDGARAADFQRVLHERDAVGKDDVRRIRVRERNAFVSVRKTALANALQAFAGATIAGKPALAEQARERSLLEGADADPRAAEEATNARSPSKEAANADDLRPITKAAKAPSDELSITKESTSAAPDAGIHERRAAETEPVKAAPSRADEPVVVKGANEEAPPRGPSSPE